MLQRTVTVMLYANVILLILGLLLELTIITKIFRHRLQQRLPLFTTLLLFYLLRAVILISVAKVVPHIFYVSLLSLLALVDLLLQVAVAISLYLRLRSVAGKSPNNTLDRNGLLLAVFGLILATALTRALAYMGPPHAAVPLDRGILYSAFLFMTYFAASWQRSGPSLEWEFLRGFALLGFVEVLTQWGKLVAASQRNSNLFLVCAYGDTAVWLLILLMWSLRFNSSLTSNEPHVGMARCSVEASVVGISKTHSS